ncbi:MAG TPA: hypothetical protein VFD59_06245 [Nocardioidaceae bacterium]|nr:hypothetical protein [Nocardioidaceae bacterium]
MTRYADPQRCPDCLHAIAQGTTACPSCDLSLVGPVAGRLFQTLAYADELLAALRTTQPAVVSAPAAAPATAVPAPAPSTPWVPDTDPPPVTRRLSAASVPKILLGLGALCLLVAALVFLAVTWSVMGIAGRTATLVGFTAVATGLAAWMATRNLRAAAEALSVLALGLLSFDLFGARDSGWLGDIGDAGFHVLLGAVVATAATAAGLAVRRAPTGALVGAEIVGAVGIATATAGFVGRGWLPLSATLAVAVVLAAASTFATHRLRQRALATGAGVVTAFAWLVMVVAAFDRAALHPTLRELWLQLDVWPLVVAAAMVGGLAFVRPLPLHARVAGLATAEVILALAALIPFAQGSPTEFTLALLVVLGLASGVTWFAPRPWVIGCAVTPVLATGWLVLVGGTLVSLAGARLGEAAGSLWQGTVDGRLPQQVSGGPEPWLLPVVAVAVIATCVVFAHSVTFVALGSHAALALGLGVVYASALATVASYPVPVWLVVSLALLAGVLFTGWWLHNDEPMLLVWASGFLVLAVTTSLYDEWLTALTLTVALALTGAVHLRAAAAPVSAVAGALLAASLAGLLWTSGALGAVDASWVAAYTLVILGLVLVLVPLAGPRAWHAYGVSRGSLQSTAGSAPLRFAGIEIGAVGSGFLVSTAGVEAASYSMQPTWTAVYLTAAGAAAALIALERPDRRLVGWLGGALLASASWVRLWDVGVQAPEAYTLPTAVALAAAGLVYLRRRPGTSTMSALAAGLGLGLVPSLLWVLWEPDGLRSVLLGLACLGLLLLGARLSWTAPVVFAASVGTLVVLRHVAPAAEAVPQWVLFGSAGALLVAMGITWERRIQEARSVVGYVRALR